MADGGHCGLREVRHENDGTKNVRNARYKEDSMTSPHQSQPVKEKALRTRTKQRNCALSCRFSERCCSNDMPNCSESAFLQILERCTQCKLTALLSLGFGTCWKIVIHERAAFDGCIDEEMLARQAANSLEYRYKTSIHLMQEA